MENSNNSFVSVLKRGSQSHVTLKITKLFSSCVSCIKEFDFGMSLMGRVKDVSAILLPCIISKEGFQNVKLSYLGGMWVLFEFDSLTTKEKFLNHSGIGSWFTELIQATSSFENDERIVWISIEGLPIKAWTPNTFRKIASFMGRKVIIQGKVYWIRVKELDAWFPNFQEDDQDDLSSDGESQEGDVANKADNNESDVDRMFDHVVGILLEVVQELLIISVYAPQELNERRDLWDYLRTIIDRWEGDTVIMGDFNEVRSKHERFGSTFNRQGAIAFNNFISSACLIDLPLEGYAFTWAHKSASKMSKLDRYLISEGVLDLFPHLSALCLDRHLSDHRPILMRGKQNYDYQVQDLERLVTYENVKRAVWDCGTNKSPGPDGFSFEFYRKYWTTIDNDVFQVV
ncbi:RNA-directed DNA polymerase, eukaryota [Tanacetum coccineum]